MTVEFLLFKKNTVIKSYSLRGLKISKELKRFSEDVYKFVKKTTYVKPLSANPEKWSNTLKQIVGNLPTICLSVFDHFMNLALKGLNIISNKFKILKPVSVLRN